MPEIRILILRSHPPEIGGILNSILRTLPFRLLKRFRVPQGPSHHDDSRLRFPCHRWRSTEWPLSLRTGFLLRVQVPVSTPTGPCSPVSSQPAVVLLLPRKPFLPVLPEAYTFHSPSRTLSLIFSTFGTWKEKLGRELHMSLVLAFPLPQTSPGH